MQFIEYSFTVRLKFVNARVRRFEVWLVFIKQLFHLSEID